MLLVVVVVRRRALGRRALPPDRTRDRERVHERGRVPAPLLLWGELQVAVGEVALHALHRYAAFFCREAEAAVDGAEAGGHVCAACVERC